MQNKYLFATLMLVLFAGTAFGAALTNSVHLTGQTIDGSGVVTGTFNGYFNISNVSDCSTQLDTATTTIITDANGRWAYYFDTSVVSSDQLWVGYTVNRSSPAYSETGCLRYSPTAYCEAWDPANDYYLNTGQSIWFDDGKTRKLTYDNSKTAFFMNSNLKLGGTNLHMNGESTIYGGDISSDSLTLVGSSSDNYPRLAMEGNSTVVVMLQDGSSEDFRVTDSAFTPNVLFKVEEDGDVGIKKNLDVGGTLTINSVGTQSLMGNGLLRIKPSSTNIYPFLDIKSSGYGTWVLEDNTSQYFSIQDSKLSPTVLFAVQEDGDGGIEHDFDVGNDLTVNGVIYGNGSGITDIGSSYWNRSGTTLHPLTSGDDVGIGADDVINLNYGGVAKTITYSSANTEIELNDDTDITGEMSSDSAFIGDSSNYLDVSTTGEIELHGGARKYRQIDTYAYNIYGNAATYNGVSCDAAAGAVFSDTWVVKTFDDCSGIGNNPDAAIATLKMPLDYEDGTNYSIDVHWTASSTSGNIVVGVGVLPVGQGENYAATETYQTATVSAPSTANYEQEKIFEFSGTGVQADDDVAIVLYRDCDDGSDTMSGDAFVMTISLKYISNKWGEDI